MHDVVGLGGAASKIADHMNTTTAQRWVEGAGAIGFRTEGHGIALDTTKVLATGAVGGLEVDIQACRCSDEARSLRADVCIAVWPA